MPFFLLDSFIGNLGSGLGSIITLILQLISFAGLFMLIFAILQGLLFDKWKMNSILIGIIILIIVGPAPAWQLLTEGFPDLASII